MTDPDSLLVQVEALTSAAAEAAACGRWDLVASCYRDRQRLLPDLRLSLEQAERLTSVDRAVQVRARVAQAAVSELLRESAMRRHRLACFREGQGAVGGISLMKPLEG